MTTNTDDLKFDKIVGILKVEEMETDSSSVSTSSGTPRGITLVTDKDNDKLQKLEDDIGILARNW